MSGTVKVHADRLCIRSSQTDNEVIENPVLSYVEPYASSACEMIAEVLQYFPKISVSLRVRQTVFMRVS